MEIWLQRETSSTWRYEEKERSYSRSQVRLEKNNFCYWTCKTPLILRFYILKNILKVGSWKCIYIYVVVNFLSQVIFMFPLFFGMVMYANEVETTKNIKITWDKKLTTTYIYIKKQYSVGIEFVDLQDKREPADCLVLAEMIWKVETVNDWLWVIILFILLRSDLEDVFGNHHLVYCLFCLCC